MKTKEEFSKLKELIGEEVAIYYVVRGRKLNTEAGEESEYFEKIFFNEELITAREQAFSFYKNYVLILEENKLLFPTQSSNTVSDENAIQKYSSNNVTFQNPELFDKGITLNMVVGNPISYMGKTDNKGDNYLIHGILNFEESDIKNMIDGVMREYGYYAKYKSNLKNQVELVDFSAYGNYGNLKYSILSTPFNWYFNPFTERETERINTNKRLKKYKLQIEKGSL